jgi:tetratricopeptide (TPR) repeat protein
MKKKRIVSFCAIFLIACFAVAQKTTIITHEDADFKTAVELFQKEKFGAAQKHFNKIIQTQTNPQSLVRIDAEYYSAICAIELFNKDGELFLKQFIKNHPESPKVKLAYFYLAKYNYRKKKFKETLEWFEKVDIYELTSDELAEFYFKRGYCYFNLNKTAEAKKDFYEIKDVDNKYAGAAKYYYAHIMYNDKNYETALIDFEKLQTNETFAPVVPYYIAQIYFLQRKFDKVIQYAPALLDSASTKRAPEIAKILGESYYETAKYKEAIPYFKKYEKSSGALNRKDNYQFAYSYYKTKDYESAITHFIQVTNVDDSLAQNAFYHIADCYNKTDDKQNARNAFGEASKMNFDKQIQEDALFSYAKMCYELAYNPFSEAQKAFQKYIKNYPNSLRLDEAYTYLVNVFTTTKNYKDAVEAIEQIKELTPELKQAYQKVAYYRAIDLYNNMNYEDAIKYFDKSMSYKFDKNINAQAYYWKGETYYKLKQYQKAIDNYTAYISEPGAIGKMEISDANYNIGYAYNKMGDYTNSILWFRKFVTFKPQANDKKINDALNRIADGYFINREYSNAVDYYEQAYKMKLLNADYSLFQKALANGVQKKYSAKIADLKTYLAQYANSSSAFVQRAKFELANTYQQDNQADLALAEFKKFINDYPNSIYESTCLSKIGLIYYNKDDYNNALDYFDRLVKKDKSSPDAKEAIVAVKKIYADKGDVQGMEKWLAEIGMSISQIEKDSLQFNIAKLFYMKNDCNNAIENFAKYISLYPNGLYATQANYYKADCDYSTGNTDAALVSYIFVVNKPKNEFTEQSLNRASYILFKKKEYAQALDYFKQLEQIASNNQNSSNAKIGLMRCNYQLKNSNDAIDYANKVLGIEKIEQPLSNEAHNVIAQSLMILKRYDEAMAEFKLLAVLKNNLGAEASYNIAYIWYLKNENKKSEKTIFDFIKSGNGSTYWVAKSLILQADNYVALKNNFQAKATLKGVIEDSDSPELVAIAKDKLAKIIADEEAAAQPTRQQEPVKIEFEGNQNEQDRLFNDSSVPNNTPQENKNEQ